MLTRLKWFLDPSLLKYLAFQKRERWPKRRVFLYSLPKSGTHLTQKLLYLTTGMNPKWYDRGWAAPNQYYWYHHPYPKNYDKYLNNPNYLVIVNIRDPRDVCASTAKSLATEDYLWEDPKVFGQMSFEQRLMNTIEVQNEFSPRGIGANFCNLMKHPNVMIIRFEDIVGPDGGGDRESQLKVVRELIDRLDLSKSESEILDIADNLFGTKKIDRFKLTFDRGQIGSWKEKFSQKHKEIFKKHLGKLLINMGYEQDLNW